MSNLIVATPFMTDAATITCATAVAAGPAANLKRDQPTDIFRSSTLTPEIDIDLGAVMAFNLIDLMFTNAQDTDTWRIRLANTQANLSAAPTYDASATFSPQDTAYTRRHGFKFNATGWTARWIRLNITSTGNPAGVFDAGRLIVDNAHQFSRSIDKGNRPGFIDTSPKDRTPGGNTIINRRGIIPRMAFDLKLDNEAEFYAYVFKTNKLCGASRPIVAITNPDHATLSHDKLYYGLMAPTIEAINDTYNVYTQRYEIEGMI